MPSSFVQTQGGFLLIANGIDCVLRWDGLMGTAECAGVEPPTIAPTLSGSGIGEILGTYFAYLRFVDRFGNVSNVSPLSNEYTTNGRTGSITSATKTDPIVVTSAAHGLTTGTRVKISGALGMTEMNGTWDIIVIDANHFSLNGSSGTHNYQGGATWIAGVSTINYSTVQPTTDPKVARRQLLRNTDGQTDTFYVDIDTTDLSSTTFSSTRDDDELSAQESAPTSDADGNDLLISRFSVPPSHKAVLASHKGRTFLMAEINYNEGAVAVTFGSTTVTGIGTEWSSEFVGRSFYVIGAQQRYEIASVNVAAQTLVLTSGYMSATDPYAYYSISPAPAERRLVYYSESGLPEAWPPTNAFSIEEDGDEIVGGISQGSFLYIFERSHIYRFTFADNPATDGAVFLASTRGCINFRCAIPFEDNLYMLDNAGIHKFDGNSSEAISGTIKDLFSGDNKYHSINWNASRQFHAVMDKPNTTMKWFVVMTGFLYPHHALCYNYSQNRWWIEEYTVPVCSSTTTLFNGRPFVFLGGPARKVYASGLRTLDGVDPDASTVRGSATGATLLSLSDSSAKFAGLALVPVSIIAGRGKGQQRQIVRVPTGTRIEIDRPWDEMPSISGVDRSVYQIGGIEWKYLTGRYSVIDRETNNPKALEFRYSPTLMATLVNLRIFVDHDDTPVSWAIDRSDDHVQIIERDPDAIIDFTNQTGYAKVMLNGHGQWGSYRPQHFSYLLHGVSNQDIVKISEVDIEGVENKNVTPG